MDKIKFLSGNAIKILAAILMLIDHAGILLFPQYRVLRIIGRVSFPLFAYMIAEGCRYTKNKLKYFLHIFILAFLCQAVYFIYDNGNLYMSVLVSFSLALLAIYALQYFKKCLFDENCKVWLKIVSGVLFLGVIAGISVFCQIFTVDYGFWGCMLPVFVSIFDFKDVPMPENWAKLDNPYTKLVCFAVGIALLPLSVPTSIQFYALFAVIPMFFYNGTRGKLRMKYFFYIFYPLHLVLLEGLSLIF